MDNPISNNIVLMPMNPKILKQVKYKSTIRRGCCRENASRRKINDKYWIIDLGFSISFTWIWFLNLKCISEIVFRQQKT